VVGRRLQVPDFVGEDGRGVRVVPVGARLPGTAPATPGALEADRLDGVREVLDRQVAGPVEFGFEGVHVPASGPPGEKPVPPPVAALRLSV